MNRDKSRDKNSGNSPTGSYANTRKTIFGGKRHIDSIMKIKENTDS